MVQFLYIIKKHSKQMVYNYNDYKLDMILESIKNDEFRLVISKQLRSVLQKIDHPISKRILSVVSDGNFKTKVTLLDIDDSNIDEKDNVSFTMSDKLINSIISDFGLGMDTKKEKLSDSDLDEIFFRVHDKEKDYIHSKNRSTTKIGRVINKLFPNEFKPNGDAGNDIESFVQLYKSLRTEGLLFELVKGEQIKHYYLEDNYIPYNGSANPLHKSCMRHDDCQEYLDFYTNNPQKVNLLILKDKEYVDKIIGRALVWELDSPSGRKFMDRIYYTTDDIIQQFKDYAKSNGWIYKSKQDSNEYGPFFDTTNGSASWDLNLVVNGMKDGDGTYPYLDTLKYYDGNTLSNNIRNININDGVKLEDTEGDISHDYRNQNLFYSEHYDCFFDKDDLVYCPNIDDYRRSNDVFYSHHYEYDIEAENAVFVYTDVNKITSDYRIKNDNTYFIYNDNNYDNELKTKLLND